jgi:hypothetical protein
MGRASILVIAQRKKTQTKNTTAKKSLFGKRNYTFLFSFLFYGQQKKTYWKEKLDKHVRMTILFCFVFCMYIVWFVLSRLVFHAMLRNAT